MLIEIRGTGFENKGAELMLHAILQKVGDSFPDARFAMTPSNNQDYVRRAMLGLYQKVRLRKYGVSLCWMIPSKWRQKYRQLYGLVLDNDVDVVLDASGFAYSEQWGEYSSVTLASYVKTWKKRGTKIVLLPQAMGPFTSPTIRKAFAFVVNNADLVFARDDVSYKYVTEVVGERENVLKAPDFTNLLPGITPADPERFHGRFCLVPNCRMIDKTSDDQSTRYTFFCAECIKSLVEFGHRPFILIHGGSQDLRLAQKIMSESNEEIEIIKETDALKIKGILGLCKGAISSRYHGLVSALSQGVPSLASGWSHKYEMLFKEYSIPDGCLSVSIEPKALKEQIQRITNDNSRKEIIAKITKASNMLKEQTEQMWQKVFSVIEK
jgi:polysaccharide pyruvyl transferase WcaK-like protein